MTHVDHRAAADRSILLADPHQAGLAHTGRLRAWAHDGLRDVGYLGTVLPWSVASFCILVTGLAVTASLLPLIIGLPVWVGFVYGLTNLGAVTVDTFGEALATAGLGVLLIPLVLTLATGAAAAHASLAARMLGSSTRTDDRT